MPNPNFTVNNGSETQFTDKVRKLWKAQYPEIQIYKHSDRFNGGIADLHWIMPNGVTAWVELKWIPVVVKYRQGGVTELQKDFLEEHAEKGIPSFVLIGTHEKCAWYRIEDYDGYLYGGDLRDTKRCVHELVYEVIHGGGNHFHG